MCGICGIINFDGKPVEESIIKKMMVKIKHRGPDDEGIFINDNIGFGFVRLSILDLSPLGHQPMFDDTGRYMIIHNGEVYNFIEIREELKDKGYKFKSNTDTEVILKAYIEWGEYCLNKFNGMWAFVIYDLLSKKIFCSRDRFGVKPFYFYQNDSSFVFASEIPPLLGVLNKKLKANNQAIYDFIVFNRTDYDEFTFFEDIKRLRPGHNLIIENKVIKLNQWYNIQQNISKTEGFSNPEEFRILLSDSIKLRLRSDVPVGVCLSGGLDSSSIVSLLIDNHQLNGLNTFSAVYKKGDAGDETDFINEFKAFVKNMYYVKPSAETLLQDINNFVIAHAEPLPDTAPYAQYKVMELAKGKSVVLLNGQGADEALAGYHYFFGFYFKELFVELKLFRLIYEIIKYLKIHKSFYGIKSLIYLLSPEIIKNKLSLNQKKYLLNDFSKNYYSNSNISTLIYNSKNLNAALLDHFEYKLEHLLKWEDRNSMFFSLESRLPFLDYRLVQKLLASKSEFKIKDGMTKNILRQSLKGILNEKIRLRKDKIGFGTPQDEWFREDKLQKFIFNIFNSKSFYERGIFNIEKVNDLYKDHLNRKINVAKEIWKLVHLELWHREFID